MATIEKIEKDIVKTKEKIAELQNESPARWRRRKSRKKTCRLYGL